MIQRKLESKIEQKREGKINGSPEKQSANQLGLINLINSLESKIVILESEKKNQQIFYGYFEKQINRLLSASEITPENIKNSQALLKQLRENLRTQGEEFKQNQSFQPQQLNKQPSSNEQSPDQFPQRKNQQIKLDLGHSKQNQSLIIKVDQKKSPEKQQYQIKNQSLGNSNLQGNIQKLQTQLIQLCDQIQQSPIKTSDNKYFQKQIQVNLNQINQIVNQCSDYGVNNNNVLKSEERKNQYKSVSIEKQRRLNTTPTPQVQKQDFQQEIEDSGIFSAKKLSQTMSITSNQQTQQTSHPITTQELLSSSKPNDQNAISYWRDQYTQVYQHVGNLRKQIQKANQANQQLKTDQEQALRGLKQQVVLIQEDNSQLTEIISKQKLFMKLQEEEIETFKKSIEPQMKQKDELNKQQQEQIIQLHQKLEEQKLFLEKQVIIIKKNDDLINNNIEQIEEKQQQLENQQHIIQEKNVQINQLQLKLQEMENKLEEKQIIFEEREKIIIKSVQNTQREEELSKQIEDLTKQIQNFNDGQKDLEKQLIQQKKECENYKSDNQIQSGTIQQLLRDLDSIQSCIQKSNQNQSKEEETKNSNQSMLIIEQLQAQLDSINLQEQQIDQQKTHIEDLEQLIQPLKEELQLCKQEIKKLSNENLEQKHQISQLKVSNNELLGQLNETKTQLEELKVQNNLLNEELVSRETQAELDQKEDEVEEKAKQDLEQQLKNNVKKIVQMKTKMTVLKTNLEQYGEKVGVLALQYKKSNPEQIQEGEKDSIEEFQSILKEISKSMDQMNDIQRQLQYDYDKKVQKETEKQRVLVQQNILLKIEVKRLDEFKDKITQQDTKIEDLEKEKQKLKLDLSTLQELIQKHSASSPIKLVDEQQPRESSKSFQPSNQSDIITPRQNMPRQTVQPMGIRSAEIENISLKKDIQDAQEIIQHLYKKISSLEKSQNDQTGSQAIEKLQIPDQQPKIQDKQIEKQIDKQNIFEKQLSHLNKRILDLQNKLNQKTQDQQQDEKAMNKLKDDYDFKLHQLQEEISVRDLRLQELQLERIERDRK